MSTESTNVNGEKTMLDYARDYVFKKGYSVIPLIPREKRPIIQWEPYQKRLPTDDELEKWFGKTKNNIGIVAGEISNLSIIDMDGKSAVDFMTSGHDLPLTPMVRTGKDYGYHLYCSYNKNLRNFQTRLDLPSIDMRSEGGYVVAPPSIHPNGKTYEWVSTPEHCSEVPAWFLTLVLNKTSFSMGGDYKGGGANATNLFSKGRRDNDLFHVANTMAKGRCEPEYIQKVLEILINSWGENDPKWALDKVKSILKRIDRREGNLSNDVREWVLSTSGFFLSTDVKSCLHLSTRDEEKQLSVVLGRLREEGIIEKYGERRGCYRLVEKNEVEIDFKNASEDYLDIKWPFGIEKWFKTAPKNIIMVAGEPDAGKTAFLLNFAALNNWYSMPTFYFSSEMGDSELKNRLLPFGPKPTWKQFRMKVIERSSDFADVIRPDAINIIDFLEIHDEFYKVGLYIKQIFDKLNKGIAVIALQKNPGKDQGLGGMRSIEKARLAINMERGGHLVIDKAKNWATMNNPRGLALDYKLVDGCHFTVDKDWHYADGVRQIGAREEKQKQYQRPFNNTSNWREYGD